jgi:biopolymer transport protein ExbB
MLTTRKKILITLSLLLISVTLLGKANAEATAATSFENAPTLLQVLQKGGWAVFVLSILSVVALVLIFYNLLTVRPGTIVTQRFLNAVDAYLHKGDIPGLVAYSAGEKEVFARIVQHTLQFGTLNPGTRISVLRDIAETEGSRQSSRLYQSVSYLYDIGIIAPMIGLAGTVTGMIMSFQVLGNTDELSLRPSALADGVAEALIATAAGLVVGTPAMIFYAIFKGRVQNLVSEMEAATTAFMAKIETYYSRAGGTDAQSIGQRGASTTTSTISTQLRSLPTI